MASVDAVLIVPCTGLVQHFGFGYRSVLLDLWAVGDMKQLIGQAEILAVLLFQRYAWETHLAFEKRNINMKRSPLPMRLVYVNLSIDRRVLILITGRT